MLRESALTSKLRPFTQSAFRNDHMAPPELEAAEARVMKNSGRDQIYGTAYFQKAGVCATKVCGHSLWVEPEETEHSWHADIHWPKGLDAGSKALRQQLTHLLLAKTGPVVLKDCKRC